MPVNLEYFDDPTLIGAANRFRARSGRIRKTLTDISGKRDSAIESRFRVQLFERRERTLRDEGIVGFQRKIGAMDDLLSYEFLEQGMLAGQAVGLVRIEALGAYASGFLVAPDVLLTNHHVLPTASVARQARLVLGFEEDSISVLPASPKKTLIADPDAFFATDRDLDFTFVGVDVQDDDTDISWLPLIEEQGKIMVGHPVNLIQHPEGRVKQVVVHNSHLLDLQDDVDDEMYCWYSSDSAEGSSGSPVFNCRWEVIALHHKAVPKTNKNGEILDIHGRTMTQQRFKREADKVHWVGNEGVRTSRLVAGFRSMPLDAQFAKRRTAILELWNSNKARGLGLKKGW